jgi:hypothetical protein
MRKVAAFAMSRFLRDEFKIVSQAAELPPLRASVEAWMYSRVKTHGKSA